MNWFTSKLMILVVALAVAAAPARAVSYQMRYLDTPSGCTTWPRAINDAGQVVADIYLPAGPIGPTVALWDRSGALSTPIPGDAIAYDISSAGELVGEFRGADGYSHPYVWTSGTGFVDLSADLPQTAQARRIGAGGQIAGQDELNWPNSRAFVWDSTSGITYLPTTDYLGSWIAGMSDSGVVAGTVALQDQSSRAFVWSADKGLQVILPDVPWSGAVAMSTGGTLLGSISLAEGIEEVFIWTAELGKVTAWTTGPNNPFFPHAVNDNGSVAGTTWSPGEPERAFVWNLQTGFTILGEGRAYDINNAGWVVGQVGGSDNGQTVVWEQVPEPSSLLVLGIGLLPLMRGLARRQRRGWRRHTLC